MKKILHLTTLTMSLNLTLSLISCLCAATLGTHESLSQNIHNVNVTLSVTDVSMETAIEAIETQTTFHFIYIDRALTFAQHHRVSVTAKNLSVANVLTQIANTTGAAFKQVNNNIVINAPARVENPVIPRNEALIPVSGKVTSPDGESLPGVNVVEKGTTNGTVTDIDGNYRLDVAEDGVLVFSFIGYKSMEVAVNGRSVVDIIIEEDITKLNEVIVSTGYWETNQKLSTGNIVKVRAKEIAKQPVNNPLLALQGKVAGLNIEQRSGVPGGSFRNLQIRGKNSVRPTGNEPLIVIDGVPFPTQNLSDTGPLGGVYATGALPSPLNILNPSDIEHIEILKDADATAIYGSLGANGVILITTKNPTSGKTIVDVNYYKGTGKVSHKVDLLNTEQYLEMRNEAFANDGVTPTTNNAPDLLSWDQNHYTDWQDVLLGGTATITNANVSVSGGSELTHFILGGGYLKETTVFPNNYPYQKGSVNFGASHQSQNEKIKASFKTNLVRESSALPLADMTSLALTLPPNAPAVFDENGELNWENGTWENPFAKLREEYDGKTTSFLTNMNLGYEILPDLHVESNAGYSLLRNDVKSTTPMSSSSPFALSPGEIQFRSSEVKTWIVEPKISYSRVVSKAKIEFLVGMTFRESISSGVGYNAKGFESDIYINNISAASTVTFDEGLTEYKYTAIYSRVGINWDGKYLLNLTGRRDGSSRFGLSNRFGNFGAIGAAWIFSEEGFSKSIPFLSFGKLKTSYGSVGNDAIGDYQYLTRFVVGPTLYQGTTPLVVFSSLGNNRYQWELTKKLELGLELGLLKDHIRLNTYYYRNRTSNQLVQFPLPPSTGNNLITANLDAVVENTGWEFELTSTNVQSTHFTWSSSLNLTIPRSKLVKFPNIESSGYSTTYKVGEPLQVRLIYQYDGINNNGNYQFVDFDESGTISNPADLGYIARTGKEYYGGIQNELTYKGVSLSFLWQYVRQKEKYGYLDGFTNNPPGSQSNQHVIVLNRWQTSGDNTNIQKFSTSSTSRVAYNRYRFSNAAYVDDGSFLRLKNVSLSYNIPNTVLSKVNLQKARVYVQAQNLLVITKYDFLDPETGGSLPPVRMITTGINLIF